MQSALHQTVPLVSFISPCYNHERYVLHSLESIRQQTWPNMEHIIIDDASSDKSLYRIEKWIDENNYNCRLVKHKENKGISYTLNESIEMMRGNFWTCSSTDDYVHPSRTERFVTRLLASPDAGMIASDMLMVDDDDQPVQVNGSTSFLENCMVYNPYCTVKEFGTYSSLLFGNYLPASLMVRKEVFDTVGKFSEELKMEDWDMWLRISRRYRIDFINEKLAFYRRHPSNAINEGKVMAKDMMLIFLSQKRYCYEHEKKALYRKAYQHHFDRGFTPLKQTSISMMFLSRGNFVLFLKAFFSKLFRWIRK